EKNRNARRRLDDRYAVVRRLPLIMPRFIVVASGGAIAFGYPVERHRRAQVIFGEAPLDVAATIAPGSTFLEDPAAQSRRRIIQSDRHRLRFGGLQRHVARFVGYEFAIALEPAFLARTEILGLGAAATEERQRYHQIHVYADHLLGVLVTQLRGDDRAP